MALIRGTSFSDDIDGTYWDDVIEGYQGHDRLWGHEGDDILYGDSGDDDLDGGTGWDEMYGGTGNDLFVVDSTGDEVIEYAGEGLDVVLTYLSSYTLGANVEDLVALTGADFRGTGNGLDNFLHGFDGDDTLNGAGGNDVMAGERGDDTYYVDQSGDRVVEYFGEGRDLVFTRLNALTLAANVEELIFDGTGSFTGTGNASSNYIEGGSSNDRLDGREGDDTLNGGAGADVMTGGSGHDLFIVDNAGDRVIELSGEGIDGVRASVSHTLAANVEDLLLTGSAAINGTGNASGNIIVGNNAANVLNGGAGADLLRGGAGSDTYIVDNAGDRIVENRLSGDDRVLSSVSHVLGDFVERLTLTGSSAINGTGNIYANEIVGNGAANTLAGGGGNDTLSGGGGVDRLFGGTGRDVLTGGSGRDGFYFDTPLNASANVDTIRDFTAADDTINLNRSAFAQAGPDGFLSSGAFVTGNAAQDANDRIVYNKGTGQIFYDADGSGGGGAVLFATVTAGTNLTSQDFFVYG